MPETLSTRRAFEGRILTVREDQVRLDDGRMFRAEIVEHRPSVTVVPIDEQGRLVLVRQHRFPAGEALLETVAGSIDGDESPEQAAQRELAEEVGLRARDLVALGSFFLAPGWATEHMYAFLARDLVPATATPDEDEDIEVVRLAVPEWERRIAAGEIQDAKSLAAWLLASRALVPR